VHLSIGSWIKVEVVYQVFSLFGVFTDEVLVHSNCFSSSNCDIRIPIRIPNKSNKLGTEVNITNLSVVIVKLISDVVPLANLVVESVLGGIVVRPVDLIDVGVIGNDKGDGVVAPEVIVLDIEVVKIFHCSVE